MAPAKRSRPAFSPPRPGKSTSTSQPRPKSTSKARASEPNKRRGRASKPASNSTTSKRPRRSSLSDLDSEDNQALDEATSPHSASDSEPLSPARSPSPTHILVEAIPDTSTDTHIPSSLIHHILNQQFTHKDTTKIKADARDLLGVYIDTFVREAIIRCAFERGEQDGGDRGGARDVGKGAGTEGWLEVSDLERVGVQLVLDF